VTGPSRLEVRLDVAGVRGDVHVLCADVVARLGAEGPGVVLCDVSGLTTADLRTLDALARLRLAVRRAGAELVLRGADADLCGLARLAGLDAVLGVAGSGVELQRQPERPEDVLADEVRDAADPPVTDLEHVDGPRDPRSAGRSGLVLGEGG
jgi:STAS domain